MHVARILPASIRRAFSRISERVRAVFADAPILFFAVVIGVALTFRLGASAVRDAAHPEPVAPTFATTSSLRTSEPIVTGPEPALPSGTASSTAEVGAAAKVQPIGTPAPSPLPSPVRLAPKPRGHGRRPIRGGDR